MAAVVERERELRSKIAWGKRFSFGRPFRTDIGSDRRPAGPDFERDGCGTAQAAVRTSKSAVERFFERHGMTFKKKSLRAAEQQRPDVARARRRWIREQGMLDPARLVFIDETAVTTNMVRLWGWGPRGVELIGRAPFGKWQTITFVAGLRHNKIVAPMVFEGPMTAQMFLAYVEQCLAPTLGRGDTVMMDNVNVHKAAGIREAIEGARAALRYLP